VIFRDFPDIIPGLKGLNMTKLYELFLGYFEAITGRHLNLAFKTCELYFNVHIPFGFRLPRSDVCNKCYEYDTKSSHTEEETVANWIKLHRKKVNAHKALKADILARCGKTALVLEFDYAQNLPLPKLLVNNQFYKWLLWLHVFSVHVHGQDKSYMFHFKEGMTKKVQTVCDLLSEMLFSSKRRTWKMSFFSRTAALVKTATGSLPAYCQLWLKRKTFLSHKYFLCVVTAIVRDNRNCWWVCEYYWKC